MQNLKLVLGKYYYKMKTEKLDTKQKRNMLHKNQFEKKSMTLLIWKGVYFFSITIMHCYIFLINK